jgi:S1-C subfamily serine protease
LTRLLILFALLFASIAPARADDISAAARGVVRVVVVAIVDDEVVDFGHGSGFAVASNRVVTNAHVVELAARYPDNVVVGVVPSEGERSVQGRLIAVDPARDLALIEFGEIRLPPLTLYSGPVEDGEALVSLGYPGNVDLATAQSAADFIRPLSPVRTQGNYSGARTLGGTQVLLHTAGIARGNSGGPLLDRCGRVIGVNSAITRADDGDAGFGFAIADAELMAFLREAGQSVASVGTPCTSIEAQLAGERDAEARAAAAEAAAAREAAAQGAAERAERIAEAREANERTRENFVAIAALLLVIGALAVGGAGLLYQRGKPREAIWAGAGGAALILAAALVFLLRPAFDPERAEARARSAAPTPSPAPAGADPTARLGPLVCTIDPARSRITVSATDDVALDWGADGCVNGRTQYAEAGQRWARILVPDGEATVSVLEFDPSSRTYANTRYLLPAARMEQARALRREVQLKQCSADQAARAALAGQQSAIRAALPPLPNERLVYRCRPAAPR